MARSMDQSSQPRKWMSARQINFFHVEFWNLHWRNGPIAWRKWPISARGFRVSKHMLFHLVTHISAHELDQVVCVVRYIPKSSKHRLLMQCLRSGDGDIPAVLPRWRFVKATFIVPLERAFSVFVRVIWGAFDWIHEKECAIGISFLWKAYTRAYA